MCISFSVSENAGKNWTAAKHLRAIGSGGCQAPIIGLHKQGELEGAVISSPVYAYNGPRSNLTIFTATKANGYDDWASAGILWEGPAGYSSLLADPTSDGYAVLFESGPKKDMGRMYDYSDFIQLANFKLK